jgi:hypothetical protein
MLAISHQYKTLGFFTLPIRGALQQRFSWSLTRLLHHFPVDGSVERAMQAAKLGSNVNYARTSFVQICL